MRTRLILSSIVLALFSTATIIGAANQGAENISIYGGSRGDVPFPHRAHQDRLKDCNTCHAVFPQETDGIKKMSNRAGLSISKTSNANIMRKRKL